MNSKLLTIAIPTYNGGEPLLEAIESCRYINLPDDEFEVLIVNNCSTDDSIERIKRQFDDFTPIRIVENDKNYGRIGNWNRCIDIAYGEYMLFLFANDLLAEENHLKEILSLMKQNEDCSLINMPWIISDYKMTNMNLPPQFFKRTPEYSYVSCEKHIRKVVETGKLPFVPLQSNILQRCILIERNIKFDSELSISSDGVFLAKLAIGTGIVGFFEKPSVIWRYDAPNRLHGHVKLNEHNQQLIESFAVINELVGNKINLTRAFSKSKGIENILVSIVGIKSKQDAEYSKQVILSWLKSIKTYNISISLFIILTIWEIIKLPLKIKTFIELFSKRNK